MINAINRRRTTGKRASDPVLSLGRVLVVEDDPILAMASEDALRAAGVDHVDVCPTTDSAMAILRDGRPEAVILDVHLSDRNDGWAIAELLQALGQDCPKIVFATGSPDEIPENIADLGTVLAKPFTSEELIAALSAPVERGILAKLRNAR